MTPSEKYTAAAYLVVFVGLLAYVLIIASKLAAAPAGGRRARRASAGTGDEPLATPMAELLFWPALLGYGEAALAYTSPRYTRLGDVGRSDRLARPDRAARRAGGAGRRLSVVDLGRLAQPLRLVRRRHLPDLGLPQRYRLLGLSRDAARRAALRRLAGRRRHGGRRALALRRTSSSSLHVGFVLAAFAGFTLAAALAALYLVEEHRLQRHAPDILRLRLPSLVVLEQLTVRTIAISLPLLTVGLGRRASSASTRRATASTR